VLFAGVFLFLFFVMMAPCPNFELAGKFWVTVPFCNGLLPSSCDFSLPTLKSSFFFSLTPVLRRTRIRLDSCVRPNVLFRTLSFFASEFSFFAVVYFHTSSLLLFPLFLFPLLCFFLLRGFACLDPPHIRPVPPVLTHPFPQGPLFSPKFTYKRLDISPFRFCVVPQGVYVPLSSFQF